MAYLSPAGIAAIIAAPSSMASYYINNWHSFATDLGGADTNYTLDSPLLASAFASAYAWGLKPYGPEPTTGVDLTTLLNAPSLACDDYVRLALYFMQLIPQTSAVNVAAVGWNGGAVGNHSQLFVSDSSGETVLLDPTIGLVWRDATYNQVTSGTPLPASKMHSFYAEYGGSQSIAAFSATVIAALTNGSYKPSDALYYCASLDFFNAMPPEAGWPTPAAAQFQPS